MVVSRTWSAHHMFKKITHSQQQSQFYDEYPPLAPWPELLHGRGLSCLYKPREVFWKKALDTLQIKAGEKALDVGCGQGLFLARLTKTYKVKGVGIDVSDKSIEFAKKHYVGKNLSYRVADATKLPFSNNFFNVVVSLDTLEHIEDQKRTVKEMIRVLKPGGNLLIYTMSKNDKFTLDWVREKLGFDIYSRAAHERELFVDSDWLRNELEVGGAGVNRIELFNAFFSLFVDEAIMVLVLLSKKLGLFKSKILGRVFLFFANLISRSFYPILKLLDYPWFAKGYSLGFLVTARKKQ